MGPPITRRRVVVGGASAGLLAGGFALPTGAQATVTVDQFLALWARLTRAAASDLDATMAGKLLEGSSRRAAGLRWRCWSPIRR